MIPIDPDWRSITNAIYRHYGTYQAMLDAMGTQGAIPSDHACLSRLRSGKCKLPTWPTGAALLNLYRQLPR